MESQRFIDTRTGEIVTRVLISDICHFEEYSGVLQDSDFNTTKAKPLEIPGARWLDAPGGLS